VEDIDDREVLTAYLGQPEFKRPPRMGGGYLLESSLSAALRDCRGAQGRDVSGHLPEGAEAPSWLGAIGYLCVLDQLNTAVRHRTTARRPGHFDVIRQFLPNELSDEEVEALYALRCALAHDYSLSNQGAGGNAERKALLHHSFQLAGYREEMLQLPREDRRWNGVFGELGNDHDPTPVSLRSVGDFVESLVAEIRDAHPRGEVTIACPGGAIEMKERYFFRHNDWKVLRRVL
jgi:hypothetical protein